MPKLNAKQQAILAYCKTGKTSVDIAAQFGYRPSSVFTPLGILQKMGYMAKRGSRHAGFAITYVSLVDTADIPDDVSEAVAPQSDLSMLVSRAHDPFNLTEKLVGKPSGLVTPI